MIPMPNITTPALIEKSLTQNAKLGYMNRVDEAQNVRIVKFGENCG